MEIRKCQMCGGNELVEKDGRLICQFCGTEFSPEAASKASVVKIDASDEVKKWYELARRLKDTGDYAAAQKQYEKILEQMPDDWEAYFYSVSLRCLSVTNGELSAAVSRFGNCVTTTCDLIKKTDMMAEERQSANLHFAVAVVNLCDSFASAGSSYYESLRRIKGSLETDKELHTYLLKIMHIVFRVGDYLYDTDKQLYAQVIPLVYQNGFGICKYSTWLTVRPNGYMQKIFPADYEEVKAREAKIKEFNPDYSLEQATTTSSAGCYVATCVYGSYDCPQVWTLRRYRDDTLAKTWYGSAFIRLYYAVSPTLVKWFGETTWFKQMWQGKLDSMVQRLNAEGVDDTPYQDKPW